MLVVDVGLKLPHWALPHETVQFTVAFGGPLVIVTARLAALLIVMELGGGVVKARLIVEVMLMVAVAEALPEVAVIVTVAGFGTVVGAV